VRKLLLLLALPFVFACDADVLFDEDCRFEKATGVFEILDDTCSATFIDTQVHILPIDQEFLLNVIFNIPVPMYTGQTFSSPIFEEESGLIGSGDFEVIDIHELSSGDWRVNMRVFAVSDPSFPDGELVGGLHVDTLDESGLELFGF
jgi:hypothetical protein